MSRVTANFVVVALCFHTPLSATEPLPKSAAFSIKVHVSLTLDYGFMKKDVDSVYLGSSVCVSSDGYLITNNHVADPGALIAKLVSTTPVRPKGVTKVLLQYCIANNDKIIFATDFQPELEYDFRPTDFRLRVTKLDSRPDIEAGRTIHLLKSNNQDTMVIKLDHPTPLPFISLPPVSLPSPDSTTEPPRPPPDIIFALVARQKLDNVIVTVTRIGQSNTLPSTSVCPTPVIPITMTTLAGDSGSIILDSHRRPVGLLASHEAPEISDLSFMIPISSVTEFYNTVMSELSEQESLAKTKRASQNPSSPPLIRGENVVDPLDKGDNRGFYRQARGSGNSFGTLSKKKSSSQGQPLKPVCERF